MNKVTKLSVGALNVLEAIKSAGKSVTAHDLKENGLEGLNSAHLKALENRGLVTAVEVEKEIVTIVRRKVKEYTITEKGLAGEVELQKGE